MATLAPSPHIQVQPEIQLQPIDEAPESVIPAMAIVAAQRFVTALQDFADRAGNAEADYASPTLTCNPGVIRTEVDSLVLDFELRPPPGLALDTVRQGVAQVTWSVASAYPHVTLEVEERRATPASPPPPAHHTR